MRQNDNTERLMLSPSQRVTCYVLCLLLWSVFIKQPQQKQHSGNIKGWHYDSSNSGTGRRGVWQKADQSIMPMAQGLLPRTGKSHPRVGNVPSFSTSWVGGWLWSPGVLSTALRNSHRVAFRSWCSLHPGLGPFPPCRPRRHVVITLEIQKSKQQTQEASLHLVAKQGLGKLRTPMLLEQRLGKKTTKVGTSWCQKMHHLLVAATLP